MKEEPVDILDEQGNQTGQTMLKSEAHAKSLWHGAAHIWIYNSKGEVLLQQRSLKKVIDPGIWDVSAAGHMQAGKTPKEAAMEEAKEELGLTVNPDELEFIGNTKVDIDEGGWQHRAFIWVYALKQDVLDLDSLELEEDEITAVKWYPLEQMAADLRDPERKHLYSRQPNSCYLAIEQLPRLMKREN